MSKVAIQGAATGTGVFTLASPATNTNRTLTLPDEAGTVLVNGTTSNVGLATSSPSTLLDVRGEVSVAYNATYGLRFYNQDRNNWSSIGCNIASGTASANIVFKDSTGIVATMTSGNLLVGTTSTTTANKGVQCRSDGLLAAVRDGNAPLLINRLTNNGTLASLQQATNEVGIIGAVGGCIYIGSAESNLRFNFGAGQAVIPATSAGAVRDNIIDLGESSARFDDIYATNGTIQTSDRNEKQDIEVLSEAEARVAVACKGLLRKFRWKDKVAEKGDEARIHFGIIAQDLQDAFAAEGLDAGRYAMFISSTWWEAERVVPAVEEVLDDEGNVVTEAVAEHTVVDSYQSAEEAPEGATERTRLGVRYPELLAFIIGAI
jgi:hypothetical protein